jgi:diguanylate cyclase (GGDEF)-like protein
MARSDAERHGHAAPLPPPAGGDDLRLVRAVMERSRAWSTLPTPEALFTRAAADIAAVLAVDAGYIVYRPPLSPDDAPFRVFAAWGVLADRADDLAGRAHAQATAAPSPLSYLTQRWLMLDEVPPSVRHDWEAWGIVAGGSWPIVVGDRRTGALVLRRCRPAAGDDAPIAALCALQLSLLVELQDLRRRAETLSESDPLTGVLNRRGLHARLADLIALAEQTGAHLVLSVVDVDGLKAVNDAAGHPVGDRLLIEIANALGAHVREGDLVARIGGDEFAVVCRVAPSQVEGVQRRLDAMLADASRSWRATAGHAVYGRDGAEWDALYALADARLYARRSRP